MKYRNAWMLFVLLAVVACGGPAEEPAEPAEPAEPGATEPAAEAPMDDGAALDELTEYYVTHYNMHHPDMVAELYADDAVFLAADGAVSDGRDAILASMQADMASQPTLDIEVVDRIITGDFAMSRGSWSVEMTPEGAAEPMTVTGNFMTANRKADGEWKIAAVLTNYDQEPPADIPAAEPTMEPPPDMPEADNPLAELESYYETHHNMGHGDMVASRYAEDAVRMNMNSAPITGRDAIAEQLNAAIAERGNPQLTVHTVDAMEIGDGWVAGGGWYEVTSETGPLDGSWMMLARPGDDGNLQIQWIISNGHPTMQ